MTAQQKGAEWTELTAILLARLGVLWLLVFVSLLLPHDDAAFYAFMGVAFIITIPYSLWLRNKLRAKQFAPLQFIVDLVLVTGLIYFTGGIQSDLTLLYPLVILSAGIVGTPKQTAEITTLAIIVYALMGTMLSNNWLVEYLPEGAVLHFQTSASSLFLRGLTFAFFGAASVYVAKRCNYISNHGKDLSNSTKILLENMPAPTLLLDGQGTILFANDAACTTLGAKDHEELAGSRFADLCTSTAEPIPEKYGKSTYIALHGKVPLPVSYSSRNFRLLNAALHGNNGEKDVLRTVTLLGFTDISHALESDRRLQVVDRITAATELAGEMANEIRTPLTALSASIQLLRHYEDKTTAADWLPNSPRRKDRRELFEHIEDASRQMNSVVQNFVDFAHYSPNDLISIIKLDSPVENEGYIGQLHTIGRGLRDGQNSHSG